ncbi:Glycosyltransferase family 92 protein [Caenorhabditis elegans]|uniref:Glycosyltransferase family 92 protein n=1 Tax=Caenorhabditis elegans TaxID=6239 RepID=O61929_CAEEL|nr:Glycosyltransferase family 92 protein [Caenorhabditis elegans]CCD74217.1 Glycosyltransferase family 92 protein [Caenorhabditis elegans]|eukprot:NP_503534.1 Uncharacterized protein CELE_T06A1.5 [Caenorhabditis elegans]
MPSNNASLGVFVLFCILFVYIFSRNSFDDQDQYEKVYIQLPFPEASTLSTKRPTTSKSAVITTQERDSTETVPNALSPSKEEVQDTAEDEVVNGEPALAYFRKLSGSVNGFSSAGGLKFQIMAAYSYKDHFSATISVPKQIGSVAYCRYIGVDGKEVAEPVESRVYPFFVVYCSRRSNATMLGITNSKNEPISTENSAKLIHRKFKEYQHNVSFCLAPIYGKEPKWLHFAELVEHYKLQGVNKFFIYIREIGEYDMKLVKSYVASGEVEIIEVPATNSDVIAQQMMAVADCLLRSRTYSKWSIYADIDERLIMTDDRMTINGFLRNVTDESIGSIAFPQRWIMKREQIPPKFTSDAQIIEKMPTRAWHETTSAAMKGHPVCKDQVSCWAKDIVHNEKAIRMLVHEVVKFYPGYREWFLDSSIGYIRHYRDVDMQSWEKNNIANLMKFGPFSNTSYPNSLGAKLLKNVLSRLHWVYN